MKIAIDVQSMQADSQFRGIGFYTTRLVNQLTGLVQDDHSVSLIQFTSKIPEADLYHFPAFQPFFFSFPFSIIKKSVITVHDLIPIEFPQHFPAGIKGNLRWQTQRQLLRFAQHIIVNSQNTKKAVESLIGIDPSKITVTYLAADPVFRLVKDFAQLNLVKKKFHLPEKFVLYVGDMNWNKNVVNLTKICTKLKYPLVVVGKQAVATGIDPHHPWNQELVQFQEFAKQNPDLIVRLGFVKTDDLVALYNLAAVLVQPSYAEGFGLPLVEAMQSGCPVITSNCTALPEITGDAAVLVDPYSISDIEKAMIKVWTDTNLRQELRNKGLQRAKDFSWEKTAQQTLEVYKRSLHI